MLKMWQILLVLGWQAGFAGCRGQGRVGHKAASFHVHQKLKPRQRAVWKTAGSGVPEKEKLLKN